MFTGLLRIGFGIFTGHPPSDGKLRRRHPDDLAFKFAARQTIFAFLEKERGEGWWGSDAMADYYAQQSVGDDPFNWIKIHPLMSPAVLDKYPSITPARARRLSLWRLLRRASTCRGPRTTSGMPDRHGTRASNSG